MENELRDKFKYTDILNEFNRLYKQESISDEEYTWYKERALDFYDRQDHSDAMHDVELKRSITVKLWLLAKKVKA